MINKILVVIVIVSLLVLPNVRRIYLTNLYPDGIPNFGSKTVFILTLILIILIRLRNKYYPPKITIIERLMKNPEISKIIMFLYKGLQHTYYQPMKECNNYLLRFSSYKTLRSTFALIYAKKVYFSFKRFKISQFLCYITISIVPFILLLIFVVYPFLILNIYSIKGMCLFSTYSLFITVSKIWYKQIYQEQTDLASNMIYSADQLMVTMEANVKTLGELEIRLKGTEDQTLLRTRTIEYNHLYIEVQEQQEKIRNLYKQALNIYNKIKRDV